MLFKQYMNAVYPKMMWNADMGGVRISIGYAAKCKKLGNKRSWPDIFIAEPMGGYHGLFIELKKADYNPLKKDGSPRTEKHILEQSKMLQSLADRGYKALFASGFDAARKIVDAYFASGRTGSS